MNFTSIKTALVSKLPSLHYHGGPEYGEHYHRYDFPWYGFGSRREWSHSFRQAARVFWVNTYNSAPINFWLFNQIAWMLDPDTKWRWGFDRLHTYNATSDGWALWLGRLVLAGNAPDWLLRRYQRADDLACEAMGNAYDDYCRQHGIGGEQYPIDDGGMLLDGEECPQCHIIGRSEKTHTCAACGRLV